MKEYFYIVDETQNGPINLNDLIELNLNSSTLVWSEDMPDWIELKNLKEIKSIPPPIPKSINKKQNIINSEKTIPTKKIPLLLICWIALNLFALIVSYADIKGLGDGVNSNSPSKFWPFVEYYEQVQRYWGYETIYRGILADYDWSEFSLFVGLAIFIFILIKRK